MSEKTHYDTLDVTPSATAAEIKAAYQILARVWHPDRHSGDLVEIASRKMKIINSAYDALKDPQQRAEYDSKLKRSQHSQHSTPRSSSPSSSPRPKPTPPRPTQTREEPTPPRPSKSTPPNPTPTSTPPRSERQPDRQNVSSRDELRQQLISAVKSYFDELVSKNPGFEQPLRSAFRWQMEQEKTALWRGAKQGKSEEQSLRMWAEQAKRAADVEVKLTSASPPEPNDTSKSSSTSKPKVNPSNDQQLSSRLREQVTSSVKFYYEELMAKHPLDKQALISTLHWQMTQQKTVMARGAHTGQSEEQLMWGWAYNAKRAADTKVEKR